MNFLLFYFPNNHKISFFFTPIALACPSDRRREKKLSSWGKFLFHFLFYENGAAEWRWWLSFEKTRYLFMTEYIKKIMKSQHSHHQQPTFHRKKIWLSYSLSSHKDEFCMTLAWTTRFNIPFRRYVYIRRQ